MNLREVVFYIVIGLLVALFSVALVFGVTSADEKGMHDQPRKHLYE